MAAPAVLAAFWVWGILDKKVSAQYTSLYKPIPIPAKPNFTTRDVSVISPVLDPEPSLLQCLESYLLNDPLEVILITRPSHYLKIRDVLSNAWFSTTKVRVLLADHMSGKRGQAVVGFLEARGPITAKVDSHILWGPHYLTHTLPCFDDPTVGTAGGAFSTRIHPSHQNPHTITPAEVASTHALHGSLRTAKVDAFVAHRWRWIVCGASYLVRTAPMQDPAFTAAFLNDVWHGPLGGRTRLDTGDDTFKSRWLSARGYVHVPQVMPETDVTRVPKRTARALVMQLVRWERSTIQSMLRCTWETPQVWGNAFVARKSLERLFRDVLLYVHLWAWWGTFRACPALGAGLMGWYLGQMVVSLEGFFAEYPYMRRYWWAAVLGDYGPVLVAPWAWLTLGRDEWHLGEVVGNKKDA